MNNAVKLNPDCVREILLTVENNEFGVHLTFDNLCSKLPKYERNELHYCCLKLNEAGLLDFPWRVKQCLALKPLKI